MCPLHHWVMRSILVFQIVPIYCLCSKLLFQVPNPENLKNNPKWPKIGQLSGRNNFFDLHIPKYNLQNHFSHVSVAFSLRFILYTQIGQLSHSVALCCISHLTPACLMQLHILLRLRPRNKLDNFVRFVQFIDYLYILYPRSRGNSISN